MFTTEFGDPYDPRNALRALKVAAARAGLPHAGLHTLRHSAASVMLTHGVPLKVVSESLGPSSIAITGDVYGHVAPDVRAAPWTSSAAPSASEGDPRLVDRPEQAVRGRSGSLRTRPLSCGFPLSG